MRLFVTLLMVAACGGPSAQQVIEQPVATIYPNGATVASRTQSPPNTTWDEDRYHLVQQFDDMWTTQQAYTEAETPGANAPPPPPGQTPPVEPPPPPGVQEPAPSKQGP